MKAETITILGLDRIGASVGLALKSTEIGLTIVGYDMDRKVSAKAKEMGAIDKAENNLVTAAAKADILFISQSLQTLPEVLAGISDVIQEHTLILDMSLMKGLPLQWAQKVMPEAHYVGVAPVLAAARLSDGRRDISGARADLYQNSIFCYAPAAALDPKAVETAVQLGRLMGALPYFVDANEYDALVQGVETLPGLTAAALFGALSKATGWRDMLRFAGFSFAQATLPLELGQDLALMAGQNKIATLVWLDRLMEEFKEVRRWIYEEDIETLEAVLKQMDIERATWLYDREKNDWQEIEVHEVTNDLRGAILGEAWGGKRKKRDKKK